MAASARETFTTAWNRMQRKGEFWGARASRVLASASSRSRTLLQNLQCGRHEVLKERMFRRDAETSTRAACAPQRRGSSCAASAPSESVAFAETSKAQERQAS